MVPGEDTPYGSSVTMEEMEAELAGEGKPPANLDETKAEGDEVPEAYRGKTVNQIIQIAEAARGQMNESVKAATDAAAAATAAAASVTAGSRREEPIAPPKEMTREELKALYDEDPLKAIEVIENQAMRRVEAHVEARIAPLTAGTMGSAENWAKQEYADEFELFGDKIQGMIDSIPNKQIFSTKKGWEDAIAYVRGQKGNFEKLVDHRSNKQSGNEAASARERQRESTGFTGRSTTSSNRSSSSTKDTGDMSDAERHIAQSFIDNGTFKDMNEYKKWQKMGG